MKPHESPRIRKKSIRGDSWPVWNRGITAHKHEEGTNMKAEAKIKQLSHLLALHSVLHSDFTHTVISTCLWAGPEEGGKG